MDQFVTFRKRVHKTSKITQISSQNVFISQEKDHTVIHLRCYKSGILFAFSLQTGCLKKEEFIIL